MNSLTRFLRSRRLALWLIAGVTVYSFLMTLVPQGDAGSPRVAEWRAAHPAWAAVTGVLGLHDAWWWPPFLLAAGLLVLSTSLCSWERTTGAWRQWTRWRDPSSEYLSSLARTRVAPLFTGLNVADGRAAVRGALRARWMSPRDVEGGVWGSSRRTAVFGSPIFHWALVGLFVFAGLGQVTRWEGKIGVVVGHRRADVTSSYGMLAQGPLGSRRDTTREFGVSRIVPDLVVGGTDIGKAAEVTLYEDRAPVATRLVYANHLLKHRSLLVHMDGWALGAVLALSGPDSQLVAREQYMFDWEAAQKSGRIPVRVELTDARGGRIPMLVSLPLDPSGPGKFVRGLPREPKLEFSYPGLASQTTVTAGIGETVELPGGVGSVVVEDIDYYARLFVVEDWSIPWLYAMFVIACLAAPVALLLPPRAVLVTIEPNPEGEGSLVRVIPRHRRVDPAFPELIREAIATAVGATGPDTPAPPEHTPEAQTAQEGPL